jgi:hypothetical protein
MLAMASEGCHYESMSEAPGNSPESRDTVSMSERIGSLIQRSSPLIWEFLLSDVRNEYFVHIDDLNEKASEELKKRIADKELHLDGPETEAVYYYRNEGFAAMVQFRYENIAPTDLNNLEAIHEKYTITLSANETAVRLGSLVVDHATDSVANILVPQHFDRYLNLRSAVGALDRAIVDAAEDNSSMVLKVPGLLAVDTIREYVDGQGSDSLRRPDTGQYL